MKRLALVAVLASFACPVFAEDPTTAPGFIERGAKKAKEGDRDGAIEDYTRALALEPKNVDALIKRGNAWYAKKDWAKAAADYGEVLKIDGKHAKARLYRGDALYNAEDYEGALADYDAAVAADPKNAVAVRSRGEVKFWKADYAGALTDFDTAAGLNPKDARALTYRGRTKRALSRFAEAVEDFSMAIQLDKKASLAWHGRGEARIGIGDRKGAIGDFDEALRLDAGNPEFFESRALAFGDDGQWDLALADARQALKRYKAGALRDTMAARIWTMNARLAGRDEAKKELSDYLRARKAGDDGPRLAIAKFLADQAAEAEAFKSADGSKDPKASCAAWYFAGVKRLVDGDKEAAKRYFQKSLDLGKSGEEEARSAAVEMQKLAAGGK